jgi:hypothetical protein
MVELNAILAAGMARDDQRFIAHRAITVIGHFALEADALRALPGEPFDISVVTGHRVDRKSRVSVRGCLYSVPSAHVGKRLDVRVGAETVDVLDGAVVVARHARALKGDEVLVLDHTSRSSPSRPVRSPGRPPWPGPAPAGCSARPMSGSGPKARRRLGDRDGTRALIDVLLLHRTLPGDAVVAGMGRALAAGSLDPAVIAIEARRAIEGAAATVVPIGEGLSRFDRPAPSIANYDDLLEAQ